MKTRAEKLKDSQILGAIVRLIRGHQSFLITTHVNPDGDGLGAECALFLALRKLGKKVKVVNHDPLPKRYEFLAFSPHYICSDQIPPHEVCFVLMPGISPVFGKASAGKSLESSSISTTTFRTINTETTISSGLRPPPREKLFTT